MRTKDEVAAELQAIPLEMEQLTANYNFQLGRLRGKQEFLTQLYGELVALEEAENTKAAEPSEEVDAAIEAVAAAPLAENNHGDLLRANIQ